MASPIRYLIDECLSPELAKSSFREGVEVVHVNFRGLTESSDPTIAKWCVAYDYALVTNNGKDFRPIYNRLDVHPGLIIFLKNVDLKGQGRLFRIALDEIAALPDLVNKLIEIDLDGEVTVLDWPVPEA